MDYENKNSNHPSVDQLQDFIHGKLNETVSGEIERHLDQCEPCRLKIETQIDPDQFVELLQCSFSKKPGKDNRLTAAGIGQSDSAATIAPQMSAKLNSDIQIDGYRILKELGRGGMGVVYHAIQEKLKRPVALKVMLSGAHADDMERLRFVREAETIAKLQHPGIVQIFEVGQQDGNLFLALELVDGETLLDCIGRKPVTPFWAATMMLQLAQSLEFAHSQGVVHRDLKPGNILIQNHNRKSSTTSSDWRAPIDSSGADNLSVVVPIAKITDFGLAKHQDSDQKLTRTGTAVGTPAYMSPEQAVGRDSLPRPTSDIYSLGAIFYELLTGRPPFEGEDVISTMMKVIEEDPLSPRNLRKEVHRDLETICLKCLNKPPGQRYQTASELAQDLKLFLSGEPILSRPLSVVSKTMRWSRRKPMLAGTILMALILYCTHLVLGWIVKTDLHSNFHFRILIASLIFGWVGLAFVAEWLVHRNKKSLLGYVLFALLTVGVATTVLTLDKGPQSAPVPLYFSVIVVTALISPRPKATWVTTFIAIMGYLTLVGHSYRFAPENTVSIEEASVFTLFLVLLGAQMHLLLRRNILDS